MHAPAPETPVLETRWGCRVIVAFPREGVDCHKHLIPVQVESLMSEYFQRAGPLFFQLLGYQ